MRDPEACWSAPSTGGTTDSSAFPSEDEIPGSVRNLPIELVRSSYASLRPGDLRPRRTELADPPLRVVPTDDGHYEILDGFKQFFRLREEGKLS